MPLPQKLTDVLFPVADAHTLCGLAIGDSFAALSLPPFWNDSHSDGKVRHGSTDIGQAGISAIHCSVRDTLGKVSSVEVTIDPDDEAAEQRVFAELRELCAQRAQIPGKRERKRVSFPVAGAYESELAVRLAGFSMGFDYHYRVEVTLRLAHGFEIVADASSLFIDARALADILATTAWPASKVYDLLVRYLSKENVFFADRADREDYIAILSAAKAERPDELPAMLDAICALIPWDDIKEGRDAKRSLYVLREIGAYSMNLSSIRCPEVGRWLRLNPVDIVCLLRELSVPPQESGAWAAKIIRALEWAEPEAMEAIREQMRRTPHPYYAGLVWDAPDDVEARAYDLMTSALPTDEARVLWPFDGGMYVPSSAGACVRYFASRGLTPPSVGPAVAESYSELAWRRYALFVKAHFPAIFDDAMAKVLDALKYYPTTMRAVCDEVADQKTSAGGKTVWTLGLHDVSHTGDPNRGRFHVRRNKPPKVKAPKAPPKAKKPQP